MTTIPNGASVTYNGTWPGFTSTGQISSNSAFASVAAELAQGGWPVIAGGSVGFSSFLLGTPFQVQMTLQNQTGMDVEDVALIAFIDSAVNDQLGSGPSGESITGIQNPNTGAVTPTLAGQAVAAASAANKSGAHVCGDPSWGFFDDPTTYISCLTSKGLSSLGLVFIGLAVGIVLLVTAQEKHKAGL